MTGWAGGVTGWAGGVTDDFFLVDEDSAGIELC